MFIVWVFLKYLFRIQDAHPRHNYLKKKTSPGGFHIPPQNIKQEKKTNTKDDLKCKIAQFKAKSIDGHKANLNKANTKWRATEQQADKQ